MRTITQISELWHVAEETGFADLGSGLFLESGKAINDETVKEEKMQEGYRPCDDEKTYLTTDNAERPEEICDETIPCIQRLPSRLLSGTSPDGEGGHPRGGGTGPAQGG